MEQRIALIAVKLSVSYCRVMRFLFALKHLLVPVIYEHNDIVVSKFFALLPHTFQVCGATILAHGQTELRIQGNVLFHPCMAMKVGLARHAEGGDVLYCYVFETTGRDAMQCNLR